MQEIFNFKGQDVRTVTIDNEPYFSNSDVCRILEINNPSQALKRLKADGVISNEVIDSLGRKQKMKFVSESNLYKLIFQSKKQEAEAFTDWVTSEVLPAIRKHGTYVTDYKAVDLLTNPNALGNFLQGLTEQVKRLETKIEKDKPKVLFADAVSASKSSCLIGELAKILKQNGINIGQNKLFQWLRTNGYLISRRGESWNQPTQKSMQLGLFELKKTAINHSDGHTTTNVTPKVTGKGQQYFINKFLNQEYLPV
ncbi:phage antirepressor KilAC domain-containing protein [Streptococcus dysgalactiae]|uniref:Antirepressor n=1 Tax=Streptococcus dysgalactiae subsp. equisimilis TaxID=119602 RepID=A0A9X8SXI1_STREQ|nr:phage antirepressor [Streptococcus dysgalactiae]SQF66304.1 Antirepressor [Streptococcus dysgalactiae subsp. equisimilis]VEF04386.1 Antirepressor [Streptococcus dysgalactiae subsp. equisimilis]